MEFVSPILSGVIVGILVLLSSRFLERKSTLDSENIELKLKSIRDKIINIKSELDHIEATVESISSNFSAVRVELAVLQNETKNNTNKIDILSANLSKL